MKTNTIVMALLCLCFPAFGQRSFLTEEASPTPKIEKSLWGLQLGFPGAWLYYETRLKDPFSLRVEVGRTATVYGIGNEIDLDFENTVSLESRWYYNLHKRAKKGKKTAANSSNFLAVSANYNHGDKIIFNNPRREIRTNSLSFLVKWGIRRSLGKHFDWEASYYLGLESDLPEEISSIPFYSFPPYFTSGLQIRIGLHR
ncbi:MAG: hypothetical protein AAGC85_14520 [Bacteroidota bacterium]